MVVEGRWHASRHRRRAAPDERRIGRHASRFNSRTSLATICKFDSIER
jgi:hypothetical protein